VNDTKLFLSKFAYIGLYGKMIEGSSPVTQALLGTLLTWGLTLAGAAMALCMQGNQRKLLDTSLGFAAGVMLAASYWSLLEPALEMAAGMGTYGERGEWAFIPVSIGVFLGAAFVYAADLVMSGMEVTSPLQLLTDEKSKDRDSESPLPFDHSPWSNGVKTNDETWLLTGETNSDHQLRQRHKDMETNGHAYRINDYQDSLSESDKKTSSWRRILLLIVAVTIHNIPEGLAVGVGFGAVGRSQSATFASARNLAIGIGIQNFPEGIAVSLPLKAAGFSTAKAIWYGQLSGLVEPVAGVLGAALVTVIVPILPYALAFAAGAMIYVVIDDIVPESQAEGNGKLASWGAIIGFIVMMSLDVSLG